MDRSCRCQDRLHREGQTLGERLHRELQRPAFAMKLLNGEFSTLCARPGSSSRAADATTTRSGPHASIGYKPPAPEVFVPAFAAWPAALRRLAPPATLAQRPTLN